MEEEKQLVVRLLRGEEIGFRLLVREYAGFLKAFLRRGWENLSEEDREEIIQDTFLAVEKNIERYDGSKSSFGTWLANIADNKAKDVWRKNRKMKDIDEEEGGDGITLTSEEIAEIGKQLEDQLPERTLDVIRLSALGLSQKEICSVLNIETTNNCKQIKSRAVRKLREMIAEYEGRRRGQHAFQ